ncbi:MAG TPA: lipopolysaccharide kinase InaA family protein [Candidatus Binatia bacterium]|nr:lipopolysaccharide kinase InaA family protein [Candidatus Binatia bacterium]
MTSRDWRWGVVPPGFKKVIEARETLMLVREDVAELVSGEECTRQTDKEEKDPGAFQGRGSLRAFELRNGETALIRPYRHGGLLRHLLRGIFFTWPPRPFRELAITEEVRRRGIPTIEVLAACVRRIWGPFYRGWLVTRQLQGGQDLWTALQGGVVRKTGAGKVFNAVAATLRDLHREGIYHRDLNLKNILVRCEPDGVKGYIIDFDRAMLFLGRVPPVLAQRNLQRLLRSTLKLDPQREYVSAHDWKRFVESYHGNPPVLS